MASKKKKRRNRHNTDLLIGVGLLLLGIVAIALDAFLKTPEGERCNSKTIEELEFEMVEEIEKENYEKAALIRDLIKHKQKQSA